ncbi:hypothetical protein ALC62_12047 [Cyphomyrmex costatus]|uniref:Uncharacterized protein n=1 Tax=Cyphomyrmex costatus TaxID=456900 RepID=A0A195C8X4_9HYME|nr:hypothetical protein ALC62_12047 [Cyphomyrmex costatus]
MSSTPTSYSGNTNTSALIDQLRHINQLVQSQLSSDIGPDAFLADEALDGSGSGDSPVWRQHGNGEIDDDEDGHDRDDDDEASGSGMGPTTIGIVSYGSCTSALICILIIPAGAFPVETSLSDESCVRRVSSVIISDRTSFSTRVLKHVSNSALFVDTPRQNREVFFLMKEHNGN